MKTTDRIGIMLLACGIYLSIVVNNIDKNTAFWLGFFFVLVGSASLLLGLLEEEDK